MTETNSATSSGTPEPAAAPPRRHRAWPWYLALALIAIVMRWIAAVELSASKMFWFLQGDTRSYHVWGKTIAEGDWIGQSTFYQAPLYPYFVGLVYSIFGVNPLAVRAVQVALAAAACVMLAEAGRRWFSLRVGVTAGLLLALYPPAVYFSLINQKPGLALPLICLLLMLMAIADARRHWTAYTGVGITLGLLALNRENTLIWLPVVLAWALLSPWPWQRPWPPTDLTQPVEPGLEHPPRWPRRTLQTALVTIGLIAILLPVAMRNKAVGGEFHLTTSQFGPNFYIGNNPDATGVYRSLRWGRGDPKFERIDATELAEEAQGRDLTPGEVSSYWTSRSLDYMADQPLDWLMLMGRKTLLTFNRIEVADADDYYSYVDLSWGLWLLHVNWNMGLLMPLATLGLFAGWQYVRRWWPLAALAATYAAGVIVFYIMARYRFPLVPLLIVPAAAGLVMTGSAWQVWSNRTRVIALSATVIVGILANLSLVPLEPMRGTAQLNLAIQLLAIPDDGGLEDAALHAERALELNPDSGMVRLVLAEVRAKQGKYDEAGTYLQEADARLPDEPAATQRFARVLSVTAFLAATDPAADEQAAARAADWATNAVQLTQAKDARALDALAAAAARLGQFEKAVRFATEAATIAEAQRDADVAAKIRDRLARYRNEEAWLRAGT